jgi:hypothetical protein
MIDWPVFIGCWAVVFAFVILNRSARVNAPNRVLIDEGDTVVLRHVPISRVFGFAGKRIEKSTISKIQVTAHNLSLFTTNGQAFDVWVPRKVLEGVGQRAIQLFPGAEVVEVK